MHVSNFDGVFAQRIRFVFLLYCISTGSSAIVLCWGHSDKPHFSLDTLNSYQSGAVMKQSAFHLPKINYTKI